MYCILLVNGAGDVKSWASELTLAQARQYVKNLPGFGWKLYAVKHWDGNSWETVDLS